VSVLAQAVSFIPAYLRYMIVKSLLALLCLLFGSFFVLAQHKPFRFAFVSDTHIGSPDGRAEEDLRRTVADINATPGLAFAVLTGDITEMGTNAEIALAKAILDSLHIPWFIIPGNHDTGWSESGGVTFTKIFGYDKFSFEHEGIRFLGCASGPYVRMSDGHVPRDAVLWLDSALQTIPATQPIIYLNHYPTDNSLDNWYEITDRLRTKNTWAMLCGHGHANKAMDFESIPGVMGRSNLRARAEVGGYNVVSVDADSIRFAERRPGTSYLRSWTSVPIAFRQYGSASGYARPSYEVNTIYPQVKQQWSFAAAANVASTPAAAGKFVYIGDLNGTFYALDKNTGQQAWTFRTSGAIFSSPAVANGSVIFGSGDGHVYCLNQQTGKQHWRFAARAAVLGSPLIAGNQIYIGNSDGSFRCLNLKTGRQIWSFDSLHGPVVSKPLLTNGKIIFGAWDTYLYCLDAATGTLVWKWSNGSKVRNLSPASCIPVAHHGVLYIVAPDRYISAIDEATGATLWRSNAATVRESLGLSADGKLVYGKTMQDTIVAFATGRTLQPPVWKMDAGFGYEHVPSMMVEKQGTVHFGTRNGVVYGIDPATQTVRWAHKIDNSMINTVRPLDDGRLLASTMDGKVVMMQHQQ
jgi:outer membrane protein assembly factor BamB